jgi:hypothetical protein
VLEIRRDLDLGEEPLGPEDGAELRAEELECDVSVVANVAREIHRRHAAAADLALDVVAPGECGTQRDRDAHGMLAIISAPPRAAGDAPS